MRLSDLAPRLGATVRGDGAVEVHRVRGIEEAEPGDLTFVSNPRYLGKLGATRASAVIVAPDVECPKPALVTKNPYLAFARAVGLLHEAPRPPAGVHPSAQVHPTAVLAEGVHVGALAVVGAGVRLGARTAVHPHVVLYDGVVVGEDCVLHSGVQVREGCRLGNRVVVQNGAVVGADGFGFAKDESGRYQKIPQVGIVVIEDDVEVGALTAVDRAALGETRIGRGTKLDNLVQVGHSVTIGEDTVVAGQTGIAGSTRIGNRVTLAGQVGIIGHLEIGDDVIVTAQTGVGHSLEKGAVVSGSPSLDNRGWLKSIAVFARLPELQRRVRELEKALAGSRTPHWSQPDVPALALAGRRRDRARRELHPRGPHVAHREQVSRARQRREEPAVVVLRGSVRDHRPGQRDRGQEHVAHVERSEPDGVYRCAVDQRECGEAARHAHDVDAEVAAAAALERAVDAEVLGPGRRASQHDD